MKDRAFTLAEVLITLAIIGVVAAMTMPVLINKYQGRIAVTKVKKIYSVLNQAVKLAEVDNGPVNSWDLPLHTNGGSQKLYGYLKPYLRVAKECVEDNSGNCLDTNSNYYYLNGNEWTAPNSDYGSKNYVRIILSDGALLWFRTNSRTAGCNETNASRTLSNICGQFWLDTNGSVKPNKYGKDIFSWFLIYDKDFAFKQGADNCYLDDDGTSCSNWILEHDNTNYPKTKQSK